MALARLQLIRRFHRSWQSQQLPSLSQIHRICPSSAYEGISRRSIVTCSCTISSVLDQHAIKPAWHHSVSEAAMDSTNARLMSTLSGKVPPGAKQIALKVKMTSPGFVYEPYAPGERISFWQRWFTLSGWRRTKEDVILEMKSAYAINRLRKVTGYTKKIFYHHAVQLYKETLKNELKRRKSMWSRVYWELVEPIVSIRTMRARMIGIDKDNLDKGFIQLTIEFTSKQKFEAYDSKGVVVAGNKNKEILVRDIWVFERSLFHQDAYWRLCARLT